MIANIIKTITSGFFLVVAIILFGLWLIFGTLLLVSLIIRLIALYTIALMNSFVSGTTLTQDYPKAIDEVIDKYLAAYIKILSMPLLPWLDIQISEGDSFRSLLQTEMAELRKSWAITILVFFSYIFCFGASLALLVYQGNAQINGAYEEKIGEMKNRFSEVEIQKIQLESEIQKNHKEKIEAIRTLYQARNYSVSSIAEILSSSREDVMKILEENDITR